MVALSWATAIFCYCPLSVRSTLLFDSFSFFGNIWFNSIRKLVLRSSCDCFCSWCSSIFRLARFVYWFVSWWWRSDTVDELFRVFACRFWYECVEGVVATISCYRFWLWCWSMVSFFSVLYFPYCQEDFARVWLFYPFVMRRNVFV